MAARCRDPPQLRARCGVNFGTLVTNGHTRIVANETRRTLVNRGTLRLRGNTAIHDNRLFHGVSTTVINRGRLVFDDRASLYRQGPVDNAGTLVMRGTSAIHHTWTSSCVSVTCEASGDPGAGVYNTGTLTLAERASIHHAVVYDDTAVRTYSDPPGAYPPTRGGGVYNAGTLTMRGDSSIHDNAAETMFDGTVPGQGGGVYNATGGVLVGVRCDGPDANVFDNAPDDCFAP